MKAIEHDDVISELAEHLRPVFESSPDGVYVWLDEEHWTCNERLARMLGYSVAELENTPHFLQRFVHEDDQQVFSWNYWNRCRSSRSRSHSASGPRGRTERCSRPRPT